MSGYPVELLHGPSSADTYPSSGGVIRFGSRLTNLTTWVGPTWACLCGVIASNGFSLQTASWLRLALLVLLVDGVWGTLWAALCTVDWATPIREWRAWCSGGRAGRVPYTQPGTPGDRLSCWLGQWRAWWRESLWPKYGPAVSALAIAVPVGVLLTMLLGPELQILSLAALAVIQLGMAWAGARGHAPAGWDAIIAVLLPWLAGHAAFGQLTLLSAGLALLFSIAYAAPWSARSPRGYAMLAGSQVLAAGLLVVARQPLAGGAVLLLLAPQLALAPWLGRGQSSIWYLRQTRGWLLAAMLLAAWAL